MSSYYTAAELEAMRKAQLRRELEQTISALTEQMRTEHENTVQLTEAGSVVLTVFADDKAVGGGVATAAVTGEALKMERESASEKRDELDFSSLMFAGKKKPTRLEQELDSWLQKAETRPVLTERDEKDRARVLAELQSILQSADMDIEDRVQAVRMRVTSYLQGGEKLTEADKAQIEADYLQYCALCSLLEVAPTERLPYRVKRETERMTRVLEKRREDSYVMEVIESIMEELGCHVREEAVLDHTMGQVFSIDGHPLCDVFIGNDGSGIMFEPVSDTKGASAEQQRKIEQSANSVCSLYGELEARAAEWGVMLRRVYLEPASVGEMCAQEDLSQRKESKKRRKNAAQKPRAMGMEE